MLSRVWQVPKLWEKYENFRYLDNAGRCDADLNDTVKFVRTENLLSGARIWDIS